MTCALGRALRIGGGPSLGSGLFKPHIVHQALGSDTGRKKTSETNRRAIEIPELSLWRVHTIFLFTKEGGESKLKLPRTLAGFPQSPRLSPLQDPLALQCSSTLQQGLPQPQEIFSYETLCQFRFRVVSEEGRSRITDIYIGSTSDIIQISDSPCPDPCLFAPELLLSKVKVPVLGRERPYT